jgi:putative restriction endonuclease
MALCRLCHWTFDEGLIGISHKYVMLLSPELRAISNMPGHLSTFEGRMLVGPVEVELWPDLEALGWHRQNVFRKS